MRERMSIAQCFHGEMMGTQSPLKHRRAIAACFSVVTMQLERLGNTEVY